MIILTLLQEFVWRAIIVTCFAHGFECQVEHLDYPEFTRLGDCRNMMDNMKIIQGDPEHVAIVGLCPKQPLLPPDAQPQPGH